MTDNSVPKNAQGTRKRKNQAGGKNTLAYWVDRVFLPVYSRHGEQHCAPNYAVELQHQGKRVRWSLGPALTRSIAAERAKGIYFFLHTHGWAATIAKYRPELLPKADPTVGVFIEAVERTSTLRIKTLRFYCRALRKIVADIAGLADDPHKYGANHSKWIERVHAVKLSVLSPAALQAWKRSYLARTGQDPLSQRCARSNINTFLRNARALFSAKIVQHLGLELPEPLPFASVEYEPKGNTKYRSTFDIHALVAAARIELEDTDLEAYKVFLLASLAGLRKQEIDLLEWSSFRWEEGSIAVVPTVHFSAKTEESYAVVTVDREVLSLFRDYSARATSSFVIESSRPPHPEARYDYYRCEGVFDRLIRWLRGHGVIGTKPIHSLRKEYGSVICSTHGIHAASRALRHSSVAVTDAYYTDSRVRATTGLGHLLGAKIVEFKQSEVA
jgi:integrase